MSDSKTLVQRRFLRFGIPRTRGKHGELRLRRNTSGELGCLRKWTAISDPPEHTWPRRRQRDGHLRLVIESLYKSGLSLWSFSRGHVGVA